MRDIDLGRVARVRPLMLAALLAVACAPAADPPQPAQELAEPEPVETEEPPAHPDLGTTATGDSATRSSPFWPLDDPGGGTTLTRTAYVYEPTDEIPATMRRSRRSGAPRLEIVALGQDFMVRLVNDRPRTSWLLLNEPDFRGRDLHIEIVAVDSSGESWRIRRSGSSGCTVGPPPLRVPPGATLSLGHVRTFAAHANDHPSWLRMIVADSWLVQTPGTRARVHARWFNAPDRDDREEWLEILRREHPEMDIRLEDIFIVADDVSNAVDVIAEPDAGVVHPDRPTAPRLAMPEELRETAGELGLE